MANNCTGCIYLFNFPSAGNCCAFRSPDPQQAAAAWPFIIDPSSMWCGHWSSTGSQQSCTTCHYLLNGACVFEPPDRTSATARWPIIEDPDNMWCGRWLSIDRAAPPLVGVIQIVFGSVTVTLATGAAAGGGDSGGGGAGSGGE